MIYKEVFNYIVEMYFCNTPGLKDEKLSSSFL